MTPWSTPLEHVMIILVVEAEEVKNLLFRSSGQDWDTRKSRRYGSGLRDRTGNVTELREREREEGTEREEGQAGGW